MILKLRAGPSNWYFIIYITLVINVLIIYTHHYTFYPTHHGLLLSKVRCLNLSIRPILLEYIMTGYFRSWRIRYCIGRYFIIPWDLNVGRQYIFRKKTAHFMRGNLSPHIHCAKFSPIKNISISQFSQEKAKDNFRWWSAEKGL